MTLLKATTSMLPRTAMATHLVARRTLVTSAVRASGGFNRPGPPPLPAQEQKEFENLVKQKQNASPFLASDPEKGDMHPDARRKPRPEFEGETNPSTGEIGGPKNDPLKYDKEWTYGGRATDF
ncbi:uncharacterized protein PAN0_010c4103 [Moesziomyces antarcticus]|uniref:Related to FMP21 Found in Mitochondrial Proteome n=2 Tax=Pseudozyma antarctica TaxID=84753 RepID=A0A5C3FMR1_PSEA2|nr:uncharacterized protein PAN0_010c4103 [Moesziomyces antarcticus]GAK65881.1 conserved hypothetical protein [Moesziomyces antarcticus]SPO45510.1 related to FMP21 Found in Mitochondrial Proteome [Moesziomyces antarcticus]